MRTALLVIAAFMLAVFAGREGAASLALRAGAPFLTLALSADPHLRGLALYQRGAYADAAESLRIAGPKATFNRGDALARAGKYADAMAAFDAVIAREPANQDARTNRAIVLAFIKSETESDGGSRAQGVDPGEQGTAENKNNSMTMLEAEAAVRERAIKVTRPQEAKALIANEQWLSTLADEPGRYLKLRIAADYARRREQGLLAPIGEDEW